MGAVHGYFGGARVSVPGSSIARRLRRGAPIQRLGAEQRELINVRRLPLAGLWIFVLKQAWCSLFGALMLGALVFTRYVDLPWLSRNDWMFLIAIGIQAFMVLAKLETKHELVAIICFHITGLVMELFKTSSAVGSWNYPGDAFFELGNVPLYSGFMYAAVGSYIARSWRVMHLRYPSYPNRVLVGILAVAIYLNFFTHHYIVDLRWFLFAGLVALYKWKFVYFTISDRERRMPIIVSFLLIALFIWFAENISTFVAAWQYPDQESGWRMVGVGKLSSWFLLMVISFVMVETMYYLRNRFLNDRTT
jgi:uncharacterized membrane protein YoaT (DUF817 family)